MIVQQQVCARIINMSDEGAAFIEQVINNMNPVFFSGKNNLKSTTEAIDVSKRIGVGKLFFCRTYDFLHVFIPKEKSGSRHIAVTYRQGLKTFRNYVNNIAGIPTNRFEFKDCTYDFLLDYRNHLHKVDNLKAKTVNNKLATVKSYVGYASARDVSLQYLATEFLSGIIQNKDIKEEWHYLVLGIMAVICFIITFALYFLR